MISQPRYQATPTEPGRTEWSDQVKEKQGNIIVLGNITWNQYTDSKFDKGYNFYTYEDKTQAYYSQYCTSF